jgi:hypothetical protein
MQCISNNDLSDYLKERTQNRDRQILFFQVS